MFEGENLPPLIVTPKGAKRPTTLIDDKPIIKKKFINSLFVQLNKLLS